MATESSLPENKQGFWSGFDTWSRWSRFVSSIAIVLVLLVFAAIAIGRTFFSAGMEVEFGEKGTPTISFRSHHETKSVVLVPSSQLWVNTGIRVRPGETVTIKGSGRINLAIHRAVQAALYHTAPVHRWVGPGGEDDPDPKYPERVGLLVLKNGKFGELLAFLAPDGEDGPGIKEPPQNDISEIGNKKQHLSNLTGSDTTVYLTVNDVALRNDEVSHSAFAPRFSEIMRAHWREGNYSPLNAAYEKVLLEERWKEIVDKKQFDVYYADNVGDFMVEITQEGGTGTFSFLGRGSWRVADAFIWVVIITTVGALVSGAYLQMVDARAYLGKAFDNDAEIRSFRCDSKRRVTLFVFLIIQSLLLLAFFTPWYSVESLPLPHAFVISLCGIALTFAVVERRRILCLLAGRKPEREQDWPWALVAMWLLVFIMRCCIGGHAPGASKQSATDLKHIEEQR